MKIQRIFILLLGILAGGLWPASAATRTWDGSASGLWTAAANWSGGVAPVDGDLLVFPAGPSRLVTTNAAGGAANFTAIVLTGSNYVLNSFSLSLTNGLTNAAPISSINLINAPLTPRASQTWVVGAKSTLILNSNVTYSGLLLTLDTAGVLEADGNFSGGASGDLTKTGGGRLAMNGTANSLDQVRIADGTLDLSGTLTANSLVISNGATLSGTGTATAFTTAGEIQPGETGGSGIGVLTISGASASVFQPGGGLQVKLHSPTPGTGYDQLKVSAVPNLAHGTLSVLRDSGFPLSVGQKFVIVTNTAAGALTTTFTNLPQNARITNALSPATIFMISYTGGSGNDVELTVVDVAVTPTGVARVWDGDAAPDLTWTNASNWAANTLPVPGDDLVFPESVPASRRVMVNTFTNGTAFNRLTFGGSNTTWNVSGNSFKLFGGVVVTNTAVQRGFVIVAAPLELAATQTFAPTNVTLLLDEEIRLGGNTLTAAPASNAAVSCDGPVTGSGSIVMDGEGDLLLNATNSFTGTLTINRGEVEVQRSNTGGAPWLLRGGTLNLIGGSIPGLLATNGTLLVTIEGGGVTNVGNLTLAAAATFRADSVNFNTNIAVLNVTGTLNLGGAGLVLETADVGLINQTFLLIRNSGSNAVIGTFGGLPQGSIFPLVSEEGVTLSVRISYIGGDGNDVTLEFLSPTPTGITRTWNGGGSDSSWTNGANWLNGPPQPGDSALFPPGITTITNDNTPPVILNRLNWTGSNYIQQGKLFLLGGVSAGQSSGANFCIGGSLYTLDAQTWAVSNAAATLQCIGSSQPSIKAGLSGIGTITKIGAGTLSLSKFKMSLDGDLAVAAGTLRLRNVISTHSRLLLTSGKVDVADSAFDSINATSGEISIALQAEGGVFPRGGLQTAVATFTPGVTVAIPFTNHLEKNSAAIETETADLGAARLNVIFEGTEPAGLKLLIAHYLPGGLTNVFAGLPEGATTNLSGFTVQIHYAETLPNATGLFITLTIVNVPRPVLTDTQRLPGGDVLIHGTHFPGATVFIEASPDLVTWAPLGSTLVNGSGTFAFIDTAHGLQRYYRTHAP